MQNLCGRKGVRTIRPKKALALVLAIMAGGTCVPYAYAEEAYRLPPRVINMPQEDHSITNRRFQGIPSLAVSPNGRLWSTWYAGKTPGEDRNNYAVVATSGERGKTWKETLVIDPDGDGPVRAFDPEVWLAPDGRLWMFWSQGLDAPYKIGSNGVWAVTASNADDEDPRWSRPRRLCDGVMMCKPLILSSGEWVLPVSFWHRREARSAAIVVSADEGETWSERGACDVPVAARDYDEQALVERRDASLWMLVRTKYGIGESVSIDRGVTWSPLTPASIEHPAARFFIRRLRSKNLLLVKHGPINKRTGRSHLTAFLSNDEGNSWSDGLLLDERTGVSYPDGQQAQDGTLFIIYDRSRTKDREILLARFSENDVLAGRLESSGSALRIVVSRPERSDAGRR